MKLRSAIAAIAFFLAQSTSSLAWTHGGTPLQVPDVVCDISTGIATGVGAGTCIASPPACTGGDDKAGFAAFNNWAVNTWQASHTGPIGLFIPSGKNCSNIGAATACTNTTIGNGCPFIGIKNLIVSGYGATLTVDSALSLAGLGQYQDNAHSARTASATAGVSSVTLSTAGQTSLFTVGQYALMTGFDLQGLTNSPFGFPSNQHYFEYVLVTAKDGGCAGAGTVCFAAPLTNTYLSTWPVYNSGGAFEIDPGGPATLYALNPGWDTTVEFRGLTIVRAGQVYAQGKSVTYRDVTNPGTGNNCLTPSQNRGWTAINLTMTSCIIEMDKLIGTVTITGGTVYAMEFQSSSVDLLTISAATITNFINGTPKRAVIANSTIATLGVGTETYGRSDETICTTCAISTFTAFGFTERGWNNLGVQNVYSMSGGIISIPDGTPVTAIANNGSGNVRVTVGSTAGFVTGKIVGAVKGVGSFDYPTITVIDATHIDFNIAFGATVYSQLAGQAQPWAVPGTNVFWTGTYLNETSFRVLSVTQSGGATHVQTSLAGGFPAVPGAVLGIRVHPAPKFTCTACTGNVDVVGFSGAPPAAPLYSYSQRVYDGSTAAWPSFNGSAANKTLWGNISSVSFNVTKAYSNAGALSFNALSLFNNAPVILSDYSQIAYGPIINAKVSGNRVITLPGVTGTQSGDSALSVPDASVSWFTGILTGAMSKDISGESQAGWPSITVTIQTDQGVVNP